MSDVAHETLTDLCKRVEAYETPRWAIEAILDVELTTKHLLDPCCGLGAIGEVCREQLLEIDEYDIIDWSLYLAERLRSAPDAATQDFLTDNYPLDSVTVIMNPPFTLAEKFVDHALEMGARKVICFQRQAWRESVKRREWWERNPPARVWVCGARATCWRFDLLGTEKAEKSSSSTSMAWYVWEKGHRGAELTSAIYPKGSGK